MPQVRQRSAEIAGCSEVAPFLLASAQNAQESNLQKTRVLLKTGQNGDALFAIKMQQSEVIAEKVFVDDVPRGVHWHDCPVCGSLQPVIVFALLDDEWNWPVTNSANVVDPSEPAFVESLVELAVLAAHPAILHADRCFAVYVRQVAR